jgi:cytochrome c556
MIKRISVLSAFALVGLLSACGKSAPVATPELSPAAQQEVIKEEVKEEQAVAMPEEGQAPAPEDKKEEIIQTNVEAPENGQPPAPSTTEEKEQVQSERPPVLENPDNL